MTSNDVAIPRRLTPARYAFPLTQKEIGAMAATSSTRTSRVIEAPIEAVFQAFSDPAALEVWMCPDDMTGKVHAFDGRAGGGYEMSLFYPASDTVHSGKSTEKEDRYTARFVEWQPPTRIVQTIEFDSPDPAFSGVMRLEVRLKEIARTRTAVTMAFEDIPAGIRPEDNDAGTRSSLQKLARYVE